MRSSFYDKISFTEREREKKHPCTGYLGFKRKEEGEKTLTFSTLCFGAKRLQNTTTTINDHQRYCQSEQNVLSEVFFSSSRWFCDEKWCNDDESGGGFVVVLFVRKAKHGTTVFEDDDDAKQREKEDAA